MHIVITHVTRFRPHALCVAALLLMATLPAWSVEVPRVTQVTGEVLRIDAGETQGVRGGSQGKVYRHRMVGGQEQRLDVARVRVERVMASSSFLRVLETGSNLGIEEGDLVELRCLDTDATAVGGTVSDLLERATLQIMEDKLTSPAGDNAFETLSAVLAREPANPYAHSLLGDMADQYVSWGESAHGRGELDRGRSHVAKALRVKPGHPGALALRGRVEAFASRSARAAEEARRTQAVADALATANAALSRGDANAARDRIAAARVLDPNAQGIAVAEERLRRLERKGVTNSLGMRMKQIPGGTFQMGSPASERMRSANERQHHVTISREFLLGTTEVTQAQWVAVMGTNPSDFRGDERPVEQVSWFDAVRFCNKLSEREGLDLAYRIDGSGARWNRDANGYRLPTEAEWEYACRAGTEAPFHFGNDITWNQVNYVFRYDPYSVRQGAGRTVAVGSLPPNAWGLHNMHGNVSEWCWDWYAPYQPGSAVGPDGPEDGTQRVRRGGGCFAFDRDCRSANRHCSEPTVRTRSIGFRLARSPLAPLPGNASSGSVETGDLIELPAQEADGGVTKCLTGVSAAIGASRSRTPVVFFRAP